MGSWRLVEKMINFKGRQKVQCGSISMMGKRPIPTMVEKLDHVERTAQGTVQKTGQMGKRVSCHEISRTLRCIHT
jgi:hypothetical protein